MHEKYPLTRLPMNDKKNVSSLSDHKLHKKKGIVATPLNDALRDTLTPTSWAKERMPEYLWLGLILQHYGRREGFERSLRLIYEISRKVKSLSHPRLSLIFALPEDEQSSVYNIICMHVDKRVLSPLTLIYTPKTYPKFNEYFYVPQLQVKDRLDILEKAVKTYSPHQSFEATDLRYLTMSLPLCRGQIHFPKEVGDILKAYPDTDHEDEKMRGYRPTVRALEVGMGGPGTPEDEGFKNRFWKGIGMITPCKPFMIQLDKNLEDYREFTSECRKALDYVLATNKEKSLADDKFHIIVGSITYALKIFTEIDNGSLGNSILGRHGIRTIIEIYIVLKYLLKNESQNPGIWKDYKAYGIGKYKLVLLKAREAELDKTSHFVAPIVDVLVNEHMLEEFTDIDLKYFNKSTIRDKSIDVGEKELYDLFYDYDSSFAHGLWGAIREAAMLPCNNASHQYHCVPDINSVQTLPDVMSDSMKIVKKLFCLLTDIYDVPDTLLSWRGK